MLAVEFQAVIVAGKIEIPEQIRNQFPGQIKVILFAEDNGKIDSDWPERNKRRWELIAKMARQGLSGQETQELAALQKQADEQLAQVGTRPVAELERLYAELSKEK
jgi:hypothetical protein